MLHAMAGARTDPLGPLLPAMADSPRTEAVRVAGRSLSYDEVAAAASSLAADLPAGGIVAVWATRSVETCVAVVSCVLAGAVAAPLDPRSGRTQLRGVVEELRPRLLLAPPGATIPPSLDRVPRIDVPIGHGRRRPVPAEPDDPEAPAFVFMTSGTTGPPKGAVLPRRAVASNLDALASVWAWTPDDVLVHALPLFHVHGLVLGVLGPLRTGGSLRHVGRFEPRAVCAELGRGGTMLFGVPTMYRDIADAAERDERAARALGRARLLVSGSAALPLREHRRLEAISDRSVLERYGLTETLMNCAEPADEPARPGTVGPAVPGVEIRLVGEAGRSLGPRAEADLGEVEVRGPNVFLGYLGREDASREAIRDGWFRTGPRHEVRGRLVPPGGPVQHRPHRDRRIPGRGRGGRGGAAGAPCCGRGGGDLRAG